MVKITSFECRHTETESVLCNHSKPSKYGHVCECDFIIVIVYS